VFSFCENAGHQGPAVTSVAFDEGSRWLVTASQDKMVSGKIWDVKGRRLLVALKAANAAAPHAIQGHTARCAVFSPDGKCVLTGGEDGRAILWNAADGTPILQLEGHTAAITSVSFSPDGKRAATGSRDGTARICELKEGNELLTLKGHSEDVTAVAFSDDGMQVLTASRDGKIIVWPAKDWKKQVTPVVKDTAESPLIEIRFVNPDGPEKLVLSDTPDKLDDLLRGIRHNGHYRVYQIEKGSEPRLLADFEKSGDTLRSSVHEAGPAATSKPPDAQKAPPQQPLGQTRGGEK
jgi:WD40 repeat protein